MNKKYSDEWFSKANKDYDTAIELFKLNKDKFYEIILFHIQQCVDKYLKGFLAFHNIKINNTHSIEKLLIQANAIDDFSSVLNIIQLTPFAVNIRYPGDEFQFSKEDVKEYIDLADKTIKLIKFLIAEDRLL